MNCFLKNTIAALTISVVIAATFFWFLSLYGEKKPEIDELTQSSSNNGYLSSYFSFFDCANKVDRFEENVDCHDPSWNAGISDKESNVSGSIANSFLTLLIYLLIFLCFFIQLRLYFNCKRCGYLTTKSDFYLSDWSVKSPPMLGILGTVISFAIMVDGSRFESLKEIFSSSFRDAAMTTILGGFVYIANLALSVKINSILSSE